MEMIDSENVSYKVQGAQGGNSENEVSKAIGDLMDKNPEQQDCQVFESLEFPRDNEICGSGKRKEMSISPDDYPEAKKKKEIGLVGTQLAMSTDNQHPTCPPKLGWIPPPYGILKLNSDVAVRDGLSFVGVGAAIRDHIGDIMAAISKPIKRSFSAAVGELLALREGLLLAKNLNLTVNISEVDAVNVAHDINSSGSINYAIKFVVNDVKILMKEVGTGLCQAWKLLGP
ncbi:hypothetical protein QYF36_009914 [Acer negundo]|nr:hypothetical protein QYF36_009914 [Acer negundo]